MDDNLELDDLTSILDEVGDDPEWCNRCRQLKQELQRVNEAHAVSNTTIKQKIVSTDLLITKYKKKCDECDLLASDLKDVKEKLVKKQAECRMMGIQVKSAIDEVTPLKTQKETLETQMSEYITELDIVRNKLRGAEIMKSQLEIMSKTSTLQSEQVKQDRKEMNKKISVLESKLKNQDINLEKMRESTNTRKEEVYNVKRENKRLTKEHNDINSKLTKFRTILIHHKLLPKSERATRIQDSATDGREWVEGEAGVSTNVDEDLGEMSDDSEDSITTEHLSDIFSLHTLSPLPPTPLALSIISSSDESDNSEINTDEDKDNESHDESVDVEPEGGNTEKIRLVTAKVGAMSDAFKGDESGIEKSRDKVKFSVRSENSDNPDYSGDSNLLTESRGKRNNDDIAMATPESNCDKIIPVNKSTNQRNNSQKANESDKISTKLKLTRTRSMFDESISLDTELTNSRSQADQKEITNVSESFSEVFNETTSALVEAASTDNGGLFSCSNCSFFDSLTEHNNSAGKSSCDVSQPQATVHNEGVIKRESDNSNNSADMSDIFWDVKVTETSANQLHPGAPRVDISKMSKDVDNNNICSDLMKYKEIEVRKSSEVPLSCSATEGESTNISTKISKDKSRISDCVTGLSIKTLNVNEAIDESLRYDREIHQTQANCDKKKEKHLLSNETRETSIHLNEKSMSSLRKNVLLENDFCDGSNNNYTLNSENSSNALLDCDNIQWKPVTQVDISNCDEDDDTSIAPRLTRSRTRLTPLTDGETCTDKTESTESPHVSRRRRFARRTSTKEFSPSSAIDDVEISFDDGEVSFTIGSSKNDKTKESISSLTPVEEDMKLNPERMSTTNTSKISLTDSSKNESLEMKLDAFHMNIGSTVLNLNSLSSVPNVPTTQKDTTHINTKQFHFAYVDSINNISSLEKNQNDIEKCENADILQTTSDSDIENEDDKLNEGNDVTGVSDDNNVTRYADSENLNDVGDLPATKTTPILEDHKKKTWDIKKIEIVQRKLQFKRSDGDRESSNVERTKPTVSNSKAISKTVKKSEDKLPQLRKVVECNLLGNIKTLDVDEPDENDAEVELIASWMSRKSFNRIVDTPDSNVRTTPSDLSDRTPVKTPSSARSTTPCSPVAVSPFFMHSSPPLSPLPATPPLYWKFTRNEKKTKNKRREVGKSSRSDMGPVFTQTRLSAHVLIKPISTFDKQTIGDRRTSDDIQNENVTVKILSVDQPVVKTYKRSNAQRRSSVMKETSLPSTEKITETMEHTPRLTPVKRKLSESTPTELGNSFKKSKIPEETLVEEHVRASLRDMAIGSQDTTNRLVERLLSGGDHSVIVAATVTEMIKIVSDTPQMLWDTLRREVDSHSNGVVVSKSENCFLNIAYVMGKTHPHLDLHQKLCVAIWSDDNITLSGKKTATVCSGKIRMLAGLCKLNNDPAQIRAFIYTQAWLRQSPLLCIVCVCSVWPEVLHKPKSGGSMVLETLEFIVNTEIEKMAKGEERQLIKDCVSARCDMTEGGRASCDRASYDRASYDHTSDRILKHLKSVMKMPYSDVQLGMTFDSVKALQLALRYTNARHGSGLLYRKYMPYLRDLVTDGNQAAISSLVPRVLSIIVERVNQLAGPVLKEEARKAINVINTNFTCRKVYQSVPFSCQCVAISALLDLSRVYPQMCAQLIVLWSNKTERVPDVLRGRFSQFVFGRNFSCNNYEKFKNKYS